jgi:hypothetical protein
MKKRIVSAIEKSERPQREFVYSILINYDEDVEKIRKEVEGYRKAGMNYFILGMSDQTKDVSKKIEHVTREVCSSL